MEVTIQSYRIYKYDFQDEEIEKIIVEAEFYNEGNRLMEFEVAWLKWDH